MKKVIHFVFIILFLLQIAGCAGSFNNLSEIPELNEITNYHSQEQLEEVLLGHSIEELHSSWGEPDGNLSGFWGEIWELGENDPKTIICYYEDGVVETVKIFDLNEGT